MANAKTTKPDPEDAVILDVDATEPVILQEPEPETSPAEQQAATAKPAPPARRGRFWAYVLAAVALVAAGFAGSRYLAPDYVSPDAIAALQAQLDDVKAAEAGLRTELVAIAAQPANTALTDRIAALETALAATPDMAAIDERLTALETRLSGIETASAGGEGAPAAALAAMGRELKSLRADLDAQKAAGLGVPADIEAATAAVQARLDAAEASAVAASRQAGLSHVRAAFESGSPLTAALEGLAATGATIPESLAAAAASGIPSLADLQAGFAEPARTALEASIRANMGTTWSDRLSSFLRSQTGVRSLTPREGTDADAVLSRAEAALGAGDVGATLTELAGLPPEGSAAMEPWVALARQRLDAEKAIADLAAALNAK